MHALVAHGDAVRDRDGAELERVAASGVHAVLDRLGEPVQREVAGSDLVPRGRDPDLGFREVLVLHADRAEHASRGGALQAIRDVTGARLDVGLLRHARRLQSLGPPERTSSLGYGPCVGWRRSAGAWFGHLSPEWLVRLALGFGLSGSNAVGILIVYTLLNFVVPMPHSERELLVRLDNVGLALGYLAVAGLFGIWNAWRVLHPVV